AGVLIDLCMTIADLLKAFRHGAEREIGGVSAVHLVPIERCGHGRLWSGTDRIGRRDGPVFGVLVVVHEHAVALFLPPLAGREVGCSPLDFARERQGRAPPFVKAPAALDAHIYVRIERPRSWASPRAPY